MDVFMPLSALAAGAAITALVLWRRRQIRMRKRVESMNAKSINEDFERATGPTMFSYKDIAAATNKFSSDRKLGEGGFGAVYKGYPKDIDMIIATKKISRNSKQGEKEYRTEVKAASQLRHRNLVQLIGWCHDSKREFLIVYEFMPNGSVDSHLFGKNNTLNWAARYNVARGLPAGLLYLHEEWKQCVVHRDIKSSNVMLDSNFNAKLGDFWVILAHGP